MRYSLRVIFLLATALGSDAHASVAVPAKAVAQLQRLVRRTQAEVVIGSRRTLPPEARPMLNNLLGRAACLGVFGFGWAQTHPRRNLQWPGYWAGSHQAVGNAGAGAPAGCRVLPGQARNRRAQWLLQRFPGSCTEANEVETHYFASLPHVHEPGNCSRTI